MTPAQQPEHCEHECVCYKHARSTPVCKSRSCRYDTRSRPHTPAPDLTIRPAPGACSPEPPCDNCGWMKEHDAAIARAATLKAYDKIIPTLGKAIQTDVSDNDYVMLEDLESVLDHLRQQAGEQK